MLNIKDTSTDQLRSTLREIQRELIDRRNKMCAEKVKAFEDALVALWDIGINITIEADANYEYGELIPFGLDDLHYDYDQIKFDY